MSDIEKHAKHSAKRTSTSTANISAKAKSDAQYRTAHSVDTRSSTKEQISSKKPLHKGLIAAASCLVVLIVIAVGIFATQGSVKNAVSGNVTELESATLPSIDIDDSGINPINFPLLMNENNDVYAWIYVPGTEVNLPVLQSKIADNYYLYHNVHGEDDIMGAPYTQAMNSKEFTDCVTVIYGHTFQVDDERANAAFGTLHNYEDPQFMADNPYFYIYTPQRMLTYQVVSAYVYDDRHILNAFDFSDKDVRQEYFDFVSYPEGEKVVTPSEIVELDADTSRIVQLSTCTRPSITEDRYIVSGVLVDAKNLEPCW